MEQEREELSGSPSFRADSPQTISAAERRNDDEDEDDGAGGGGEEDDFEFAFVLKDPEARPAITADEIFADGRIRPVYPVFDRRLLLDESESESVKAIRMPLRRLLIEERKEEGGGSAAAASSSSGSEADELEGVPEGTYCVWAPPGGKVLGESRRCRKSGSTGSSLRWRIRDLVGRSRSDGKEKFVFLAAEERTGGEGKGKGSKGKDGGVVTAHPMYYGGKSEGKGKRRSSYLPYKQDIVGFFANVNGLSRTHNPL